MNTRQGLLITLLLLPCGSALASEWVVLGRSTDEKIEASVDVSSIRVTGNIRRVWSKLIYSPHTRRGAGESASKWLDVQLSRIAFDCDGEQIRFESHAYYFEDGTNNTDPAAQFPTPWEPVIPDTVMDMEMKFICSWSKGAG